MHWGKFTPSDKSTLQSKWKNTPSDKSTFDGDKSFPLPGEKFLQELNHSSKDFKDFKESQNADFIDSLSVENKN